MGNPTVKDRRLHPRLGAEFSLQGTPESGGVVARMTAQNLSAGGLYCTSTVDFPEMTRLSVRLMLPLPNGGGQDTEPLDVEAVVVRREQVAGASGAARFELALYFTKLEDAARDQLKRFLDSR